MDIEEGTPEDLTVENVPVFTLTGFMGKKPKTAGRPSIDNNFVEGTDPHILTQHQKMSQTLKVTKSLTKDDKKLNYNPYINEPTQTIDTRNGECTSPF